MGLLGVLRIALDLLGLVAFFVLIWLMFVWYSPGPPSLYRPRGKDPERGDA